MRIIAKSRLKLYWETSQDIKNMLRNVSFVANDRVVFNVMGNDYRIICALDYPRYAMFIKKSMIVLEQGRLSKMIKPILDVLPALKRRGGRQLQKYILFRDTDDLVAVAKYCIFFIRIHLRYFL